MCSGIHWKKAQTVDVGLGNRPCGTACTHIIPTCFCPKAESNSTCEIAVRTGENRPKLVTVLPRLDVDVASSGYTFAPITVAEGVEVAS